MEARNNREIAPRGVEYEARPSFRRTLERVKQEIRIEGVAADLGEFRLRADGSLVGRCVAPSHEDRTPSMFVYPASQRFRCFGCGEGGDVFDLVMLVEGCALWESLMLVTERYGVELPPRPASWFKKDARQREARDLLYRARVERTQRRIFRWCFAPDLEAIEDDNEREAEISRSWETSRTVARILVAESGFAGGAA